MRRRAIWFALMIGFAVVLSGCSVNSLFGTPVSDMDTLDMLPGQGEVDPNEPEEALPVVEDDEENEDYEFVLDEALFLLDDADEDMMTAFAGTGIRVQQGWIRQNSANFRTPYYVITAPKSGPTLFIVGGVHGNEPSGYTTAERIVKDLRPDKGRIVVVPRANAPATRNNRRGVSSLPDLNRRFPLKRNPIGATANELFALVKRYNPDWFLDLHEGYDYHIINKKSVGQSVIVYPTGRALSDASGLVSYLNRMPAVTKKNTRPFTLIRNPVQGSIARKVGQDLRIPSAIIETTTKDLLARRIGFHTYAVRYIASRIGMDLK